MIFQSCPHTICMLYRSKYVVDLGLEHSKSQISTITYTTKVSALLFKVLISLGNGYDSIRYIKNSVTRKITIGRLPYFSMIHNTVQKFKTFLPFLFVKSILTIAF